MKTPIRRKIWPVLLLTAWLATLALPAAAQETEVVSRVDGDPITRAEFQARVRLVRWQFLHEIETLYDLTGGQLELAADFVQNRAASLQDPVTLGDDVLELMETERLLHHQAAELGLLPTDEEIDAEEAYFFSRWTNVPPEEIATDAEAQAFIADWYSGAMAASGMSKDDLRRVFAAEALTQKLYAYVAENVPQEELAVHTRHILCAFNPENPRDPTPPDDEQRAAAESCAQTAMIRLANGEKFEAVARSLSDDLSSSQRGGDVGWTFLSTLTPNYADAARDAELNTVIGPVETEFGFHVLEVLEREMRPLSDEEYRQAQVGYFQTWVEALYNQATIERSDHWQDAVPTEPTLDELDEEIRDAVQAVLS